MAKAAGRGVPGGSDDSPTAITGGPTYRLPGPSRPGRHAQSRRRRRARRGRAAAGCLWVGTSDFDRQLPVARCRASIGCRLPPLRFLPPSRRRLRLGGFPHGTEYRRFWAAKRWRATRLLSASRLLSGTGPEPVSLVVVQPPAADPQCPGGWCCPGQVRKCSTQFASPTPSWPRYAVISGSVAPTAGGL